MSALFWVYDDGGRADAGFKGHTGDCVCRAIAIGTGTPYRDVYNQLNALAHIEKKTKRMARSSSARTGVYRKTYEILLQKMGWEWVPLMGIGTGCTAHLREGELPDDRPIIAAVSRHLVAVVNGVIYDTSDPTRGGDRCVYGYYQQKGGARA